MRAILINPYTTSINEVVYNGKIDDIYRLLSWLDHRVSVVEIAGYLVGNDALYVDEEGHFKSNKRFFRIAERTFCGCGLVVGTKFTGDDKDATIGLVALQTNVKFLGASYV